VLAGVSRPTVDLWLVRYGVDGAAGPLLTLGGLLAIASGAVAMLIPHGEGAPESRRCYRYVRKAKPR
jgi:hypothetical protein